VVEKIDFTKRTRADRKGNRKTKVNGNDPKRRESYHGAERIAPAAEPGERRGWPNKWKKKLKGEVAVLRKVTRTGRE